LTPFADLDISHLVKTKSLRRKPASIAKTRWAAYAAAGAATALAGTNSLEAAIHYSGRLDVQFPPNTIKTFPLDQASYDLQFEKIGSFAGFNIHSFSGGFRGFPNRHGQTGLYYVSKLRFGQNISSGGFAQQIYGDAILAGYHSFTGSQWTDRGVGYVGFRFNSGAGVQYGWARVWMTGGPGNPFKVVSYAYADPGEPIRAGQRCSTDEQAPEEGSLGWLALGAAGLLAWRKRRSRAAQ
jgi:MYXO-CTERM domain-containing protein